MLASPELTATSLPQAASESLFDRIALSLSGGGFRASAYSLGTLKVLYLLGVLDQVHMLSTASGGTITGAYYALRRKQGHSFQTIYQDFYSLLEQDTILPHALARWQATLASAGPGYKLIQAFADVYSQEVYENALLGIFWEADASAEAPFHLQSIIFGATEMYSGLTFRFQHGSFLPPPRREDWELFKIGNRNVSIPSEYARKLRLGDVVAASSCFPAGFEPMVLPDDFFPANTSTNMVRKDGRRTPDSVALLDGGIYDNQGIESLLLANARNSKYAESVKRTHHPRQAALLQPSTLFLVADVGAADKNIYVAPAAPEPAAYPSTLRQLRTKAVLLLVGLGVVSWMLTMEASTRFFGGLVAGLTLVTTMVLGVVWWGWKRLHKALLNMGPELPGWVLPSLSRLTLRQLRYLLRLRVGSTLELLTTVFMRRVRSLNYDQLYRRPETNKPAREVLTSIIGTIATDYEQQQVNPRRKKVPSREPKVRDQLAAVYETITQAQAMGTTLWWQEDKHRLPAIVASAEITLCYQLLRRFERNPTRPHTREAEVERRARLLWEVYQRQGKGHLVSLDALSVSAARSYEYR